MNNEKKVTYCDDLTKRLSSLDVSTLSRTAKFNLCHTISPDKQKEEFQINTHKTLELDINIFKSNAILRDTKRRQKEQKKKILEEWQCRLKKEEELRLELQRNFEIEQKQLIAKKNHNETEILLEIDKYSKDVQEESRIFFENLRKIEELKLTNIWIEAISSYYKMFKDTYENIEKFLQTIDRKTYPKIEEYYKILRMLFVNFENLKSRIRNNEIGPVEVKFAANIFTSIESLHSKLQKDFELLNEAKQLEQAQKQVLEPTQITSTIHATQQPEPPAGIVDNVKIATAPDAAQKKTTDIVQNSNLTNYIDPERLEYYNNLMEYYYTKLQNYTQVMNDEKFRKQRTSWRNTINTSINIISADSPQHLQDTFNKIFNFISGVGPKPADGTLRPTEHPLGNDFCLILLAKQFVSQGEKAVSSNAQLAFPFAAIIVALWQKLPDFGKLYLASTYEECPYTVPYIVPKSRDLSEEDYCKMLKYRIVDGAMENQVMFLKRQAGIVRLYSAVLITQTRLNSGPHPFGLKNGWKLLRNLLNLEPIPDICATVIYELLHTVGSTFLQIYGKQFLKLIFLIQQEYMVKLSKIDKGGPKSRLEEFLSTTLREGRIDTPEGILAPNFW